MNPRLAIIGDNLKSLGSASQTDSFSFVTKRV